MVNEKTTLLMLVLAVRPGMLRTQSAVPCAKGLCGPLPAMDGLAPEYAVVKSPAVPPMIVCAGVAVPAKPSNV